MIYTPESRIITSHNFLNQLSFQEYTPPIDHPELWGNPEYNPLLQKELPLDEEAIALTQTLELHPFFAPCIQININGGLTDPKWMNCFGHNMLAGRANIAQAVLTGSPPLEVFQAGGGGFMHDAAQKFNKQKMQMHAQLVNGEFVTCKVSPADLFAAEWNEQPVEGIAGLECFDPAVLMPTRVTHLDWRNFYQKKWTKLDEMTRMADNIVAAPRNADGAYGMDQIMDAFDRINLLKKYKPEMNEEGKKPEYYGQATFDVLEDITRRLIPSLTSKAFIANPDFMHTYYEGDYVQLIKNIVEKAVPLPMPPTPYPPM